MPIQKTRMPLERLEMPLRAFLTVSTGSVGRTLPFTVKKCRFAGFAQGVLSMPGRSAQGFLSMNSQCAGCLPIGISGFRSRVLEHAARLEKRSSSLKAKISLSAAGNPDPYRSHSEGPQLPRMTPLRAFSKRAATCQTLCRARMRVGLAVRESADPLKFGLPTADSFGVGFRL